MILIYFLATPPPVLGFNEPVELEIHHIPEPFTLFVAWQWLTMPDGLVHEHASIGRYSRVF
jgi:hypothetical protein